MADLNPLVVLESNDGVNHLKIEYISDENIPETLNGESGFHVYHVRMLTELILKQLQSSAGSYVLSDDEIYAMSVASSLHDIGKARVPKSILDYPGKLSPVEYDIIKKHSVFGEEIVLEAACDIDPAVIKYACEITRYHHERIDGTGYPDALKGDDIPIGAKVVALADSFDALTSQRSYKDAFSQDVAIEMISNGMCGAFDDELVEALLRVVNSNVLVKIREAFKKSRMVVEGPGLYVPRRVLIIGNIGYVTDEFIDVTFATSKVVAVGETDLESRNGVKVFASKNPPVRRIFETYEFDVIIYFANELTYGCQKSSDAEELRRVLEYTANSQKNAKFIYFSSLDGAFEGYSDKAIIVNSKESLCEYYHKHSSLDVKIVKIPYLYSATKEDDFLYKIFEQTARGKVAVISEFADARCYFISMDDLSHLVGKLIDNWQSGIGSLTVNDEFGVTFGELCDAVQSLNADARFDYAADITPRVLKTNNKALRIEYGYFSKISIITDLEEQYQRFMDIKFPKLITLMDKIKNWMAEHTLGVKLIELFALFVLTEILVLVTGSAIYFSIVDFRMAYIVIMATLHGLSFGIAASGLSSLSWLVAKVVSGTNLITIFYEPTNWLSFVFFFLVGALCGYIKLRSDDKIKYLDEQNDLVEEKLVFTRELYADTFEEKRELKKQIIGSKDSFGKIFDITKQLDTVEPRELYLRIMDTFEDILENKSISVYSITENSAFGRLEVASRDIISSTARSVSLDAFDSVIKKVASGEVWRNTELKKGLPMYASGAWRQGRLELLIFVWHASSDQRSLYYVNLFKILCDLAQMSLLRAYDYNQAIYETRYIKGTGIMSADAFEKIMDSFKSMADRKVFSYVVLEFDGKGRSLEEMYRVLSGKIRANDILGVGANGRLNLLLSQATRDDLGYILPRFENTGIDVTVI